MTDAERIAAIMQRQAVNMDTVWQCHEDRGYLLQRLREVEQFYSDMSRSLAVHADEVKAERDAARAQVEEKQATFDLRWKADMRAIERWQQAHPDNDLVWPDHADMVVWLLDELTAHEGKPRAMSDLNDEGDPVTDEEYQRPLFGRRMAVCESLRVAGLSMPFTVHPMSDMEEPHATDWLQHDAAMRFDRALWDRGYQVVKRRSPNGSG